MAICENWDLSIDLKLPFQNPGEWINVFGVTIKNPDKENPALNGQSLPAVWIHPSSSQLGLNLRVSYWYTEVGSKYHPHDILTNYDWDSWINLKVSQTEGMYEVKVDDVSVHTISNSNTQAWENVKIVMGNTNGWYISAIGEYRNFEFRSCLQI